MSYSYYKKNFIHLWFHPHLALWINYIIQGAWTPPKVHPDFVGRFSFPSRSVSLFSSTDLRTAGVTVSMPMAMTGVSTCILVVSVCLSLYSAVLICTWKKWLFLCCWQVLAVSDQCLSQGTGMTVFVVVDRCWKLVISVCHRALEWLFLCCWQALAISDQCLSHGTGMTVSLLLTGDNDCFFVVDRCLQLVISVCHLSLIHISEPTRPP